MRCSRSKEKEPRCSWHTNWC